VKRIALYPALILVAATAAGCGKNGGANSANAPLSGTSDGGWELSSKNDAMSGQLTTSASKVLELGTNGQIKAKVDFVCRSQPSQKQPELLDIAISTYSSYNPKGESVAATISRHFQIRLDDLPASEFDEPTVKAATEEANTARINFQYYYTENLNFAKLIASKLTFTESPKLSPDWNEIQRNGYAKDVDIIKNFKSTDVETLSN